DRRARRVSEGRAITLAYASGSDFIAFICPKRICHAAQVSTIADALPRCQTPRNFHNQLLAHAEDKQIGLAVEQDRAANGVAPVVVMGEPAERSSHAAGDYRHAGKSFAAALAIGKCRAIGPEADLAARRIGVVVAYLLVGRVMIDERIHVAGADGKEEPGPAE